MDTLYNIIGYINSDNSVLYACIRGILIYIYAIFLLRYGAKRFHMETVIDFILIIMIGAVLSRTINGKSTLLLSICGSLSLIIMHKVFAILTFYSPLFGKIIKGEPLLLFKNGHFIYKNMKKNHITKDDLEEMYREKLHHNDIDQIQESYLERTGKISFLEKK